MDSAEIGFTYSSRTTCYKFVLIGDVHLGNSNTDEQLVKDTAERIKERNTFWIDLGDKCEFINMKDRRFEPSSLPDWVELSDLSDLAAAQVRRYAEIFKPISHKCLASLKGNHETALSKHFERNIYGELNTATGLGAKPKLFELNGRRDLGYSGFLRLRFGRQAGGLSNVWSVTMFLHHGSGGGQLAGAKALRLERLPMAFDADIYAKAHTHTKMVLHKRRIRLNPRGLEFRDVPLIMINVGSFMPGERNGYAEQKELYPQALGPVELWVWPDKQEIRVIT